MTILCSQKEIKYSTVVSKLNQVTVLLVTAAVVSVHYIEKGRKNHPWGNTIQLYCLCVEKLAFWLVIYIKTFNKINNKTSTTQ